MAKADKPNEARFRHMFNAGEAGEGPFHVKGGDDAEIITIPKEGWKRVSTPCEPDNHNLVLDPTEQSIDGHVGMKCTRCKAGFIVKDEALV